MTLRWYFGSSILVAVAVACNLSSQPIPPELGADQADAAAADARSTGAVPSVDAGFEGEGKDGESDAADASNDASADAATDAPNDGG